MILECYYTKRFHDSYYLQRCTHLCLKNKPSKFKGAGARKDKHQGGGGGGALGYFLGGYVPPGTPNWHPVLKKIFPKIDTLF